MSRLGGLLTLLLALWLTQTQALLHEITHLGDGAASALAASDRSGFGLDDCPQCLHSPALATTTAASWPMPEAAHGWRAGLAHTSPSVPREAPRNRDPPSSSL